MQPRGAIPPSERLEWIVANADRFVPYADRTFSLYALDYGADERR